MRDSAGKIRIAMLACTRYPTDARVRRQAEALAARGDEVVCYCLRSGARHDTVMAGVRVIELPVSRYRGGSALRYLATYFLFAAIASWSLLKGHLRRRYDVVQVHALPDFLVLAALPLRLLGARIVLDVHDTAPETFACKFGLSPEHPAIRALNVVERVSSALAEVTIAVHEVQKRRLLARGIPASKLRVVMNGPDERHFRPARRPEARGEGLRILYHGTIARRHGLDLLVAAVGRLAGRIPGLELTICGEGDGLGDLQRLAEKLEVHDRVRFAGMRPLEEMASRLAGADLVVLPLRADPATDLMLPVKALEAMACGVPVAAAASRALRHHFSGEAVLYFRPDDVNGVVSAILEVHRNPAAAAARAARAASELKRYAWKSQRSRYLQIIDEAAGPRRAKPVPACDRRIYPNVTIGPGAVIEEFVVIGRPPAGAEPGEHPTVIGEGAVIRSHTVIYAGNSIGDRFSTGHHCLIREHNSIGSDVSVGSGSVIEHHVTVRDRVRIHSQAFIPETSVLEEECWIGPNVVLTNAYHPLCPKAKQCLKGATVRRGAKVGANATLLPDIVIGEEALVGAGSVVVRDVPPGAVVSGVPAKVVKDVSDLTCPYDLIERPYAAAARGAAGGRDADSTC